MTPNEILSVAISSIALIVSLVSIILQYTIRDDFRYLINDARFVSIEPSSNEPHTAAITLNTTFFNLGNRAAAVTSLQLFVHHTEENEVIKDGKFIGTANFAHDHYLLPLERAGYGFYYVKPMVVSKEDVASSEFVFNLFEDKKAWLMQT